MLKQTPLSDPARRTVVRGAVAVGVTAVAGSTLTACGGDDGSAADEPGPGAPPAAAPTPAGAGTVLAPTADIPVGGGRIFASAGVVVTQPKKGTFKAFSATCTHKGCPVTQVTTVIACPCHGSEFSITDGSVARPPAESPLPPVKITTKGGTVRIA